MLVRFFMFTVALLLSAPALSAQITTNYQYDVHGRLIIANDSNHEDMFYAYDKAHNLEYAGVDVPPSGQNSNPSCSSFWEQVPASVSSTQTYPIPHCTDPDGDTLILTQVTDPNGPATASVHTNDRIYFDNLQPGFTITTFTVSDGKGGAASAQSIVERQQDCGNLWICF